MKKERLGFFVKTQCPHGKGFGLHDEEQPDPHREDGYNRPLPEKEPRGVQTGIGVLTENHDERKSRGHKGRDVIDDEIEAQALEKKLKPVGLIHEVLRSCGCGCGLNLRSWINPSVKR